MKKFNVVEAWKYLLQGKEVISIAGLDIDSIIYKIVDNTLMYRTKNSNCLLASNSMNTRQEYTLYQEAHDFTWALEQLQKGKAVTRMAWSYDAIVELKGGLTQTLSLESLMAKDWVLKESSDDLRLW